LILHVSIFGGFARLAISGGQKPFFSILLTGGARSLPLASAFENFIHTSG
jgi:hypothetical protein